VYIITAHSSNKLSQIAVADKDSPSCLKLRFSNHQILKTISLCKQGAASQQLARRHA
jgi:hypothetical protein